MAGLLLSACATPQPSPLLDRFEALLAQEDSATLALSKWCRSQGISADPVITATQVPGGAEAEPADLRARLAIGPDEPVAYRHVRLSCGAHVLSEAHNWYVPARLTADMNKQLASSDTPFGKVAAPLHYRRERLASQRGQGADCPSGVILTHHAMLRLPDGRPLALLVECYTEANLARR